jgi:hypothetical protein
MRLSGGVLIIAAMRFALPLALAVLLALSFACGDSGEGGTVQVTMTDDSLTLEPTSVPKGPIEFDIKNDGKEQHSLLIIETSIPADQLPTKDDGSLDDDAPDIDVKHEVEEIDDGDDTGRTYDLDPGTYVLISNKVREREGQEVADYSEGMYATLTVTEDGETAAP